MKNLKVYISLCTAVFLIYSCDVKVGNDGSISEEKTEEKSNSSGTTGGTQTQTTSNGKTIKAKFIDFNFGDASHFYFEDESGKDWEFADSDDKNFEFAVELPEGQITDENQGWGPDKSLQGKWFILKYEYREMPQYEDGPMATLPVIIEAELVK
jgi:hypothetical protein